MATKNSQQKLKILVLHGYRQNAEIFKQRTGSLRKMINKWAEFTYITAPHKVLLVDDINDIQKGDPLDEEQYGWFFNRENLINRGVLKGGPAQGFEESVKLIENTFEKDGPFDGILGFSQGACFLGLLCDLQQRGLLNKHVVFNFAILISGFKSNSLVHLKYYKEKIDIPTLHVFGENDEIIPTEFSEDLSECFTDPNIIRHPGGHFVPASSAQKEGYTTFIKNMFELLKDENS